MAYLLKDPDDYTSAQYRSNELRDLAEPYLTIPKRSPQKVKEPLT